MTFGSVTAIVWPTYAGLSGSPDEQHEPFDDPDYDRGAITWTTHGVGDITGRATVFVPKGVYTHILFFAGPQQATLMGSRPLAHPFTPDRAGFMDIDPIVNQDYQPRRTL